MPIKQISLTQFSGGQSPNEKLGVANSFRRLQNINVHEDPSTATLFQKFSKVSGSTVTDLVKWMADGTPHDTNRYFYDLSGNLYKETSGGTWSVDRSGASIGNATAGQGLHVFDNALYYTTANTIGRKNLLSGTPAFNDNFLSDGTIDLDQSGGGTGATNYTTPTSINEGATHRQTFVPTRDPLKGVKFTISAAGTGNVTFTIHDIANNSVGSVTYNNGTFGTGTSTFVFSTFPRLTIGNTYHIHITSTVADTTIATSTNNDLEAAQFGTVFGILVTDANYHPMRSIDTRLLVGNNQYLAVFDTTLYSSTTCYNPNQLDFGPGWSVRSMTIIDEMVAIGCARGNDPTASEQGRIYFWDGLEPTYNYYKDVPLGLVNALHNSRNRLMSVLGQRGQLFMGADPFQKVQELPLLGRGKTIEVMPGAITEWKSKTYIGYGRSTSDASVYQGVYEYGAKNDNEPEVLVHVGTISTGTTQSTSVHIGSVMGVGDDLYVGWRDGSTYGVDKLISTSGAATTGSIESLIIDSGVPFKDGIFHGIDITYKSLPADCTITPKYKLNRAAGWTSLTSNSTLASTRCLRNVRGYRYKELEIGVDIASSSGNFPEITSITALVDPALEEDET